MIRVIDKRPDCGKIAFYFREPLKSGDVIRASNVIKCDGSIPNPTDRMVCHSCGRDIYGIPLPLKMESWRDWFIIDEDAWEDRMKAKEGQL